jgi:hypothetical protein
MRPLLCVIALGSALLWSQSKPAPTGASSHRVITIEQVLKWEDELSNWGRWGKYDERGALNLITPQKEVQAAKLVKGEKYR